MDFILITLFFSGIGFRDDIFVIGFPPPLSTQNDSGLSVATFIKTSPVSMQRKSRSDNDDDNELKVPYMQFC